MQNRVAKHNEFENCAAQYIKKYGVNSILFKQAFSQGSAVSLYHGTAGIAYTYLRMSIVLNKPELLSAANTWIDKIKKQVQPTARQNFDTEIKNPLIGAYSLFYSNIGIYVVDAMIQYKLGDIESCIASIDTINELSDSCYYFYKNNGKDKHVLDTLQGPAGILIATSLLLSFSLDSSDIPSAKLEQSVKNYTDFLVNCLKQQIFSEENYYESYLGFAHGFTGVLYSILNANNTTHNKLKDSFKPLLYFVASYSSNDFGGLSWPVCTDSGIDPLTGWCNGSSGYILLWLAAAEMYNDHSFIDMAYQSAEHIWAKHNEQEHSLCCGLAGESLAIYSLAKITNENKWYDRGLQLAGRTLNSKMRFSKPSSLFQGKVGIYLLSAESLFPESSSWPVCQSPLC